MRMTTTTSSTTSTTTTNRQRAMMMRIKEHDINNNANIEADTTQHGMAQYSTVNYLLQDIKCTAQCYTVKLVPEDMF